DLFRREMSGVKPLKPARRHRHTPQRKPVPVRRSADAAAIADVFSDAPLTQDCPEQLSYARSGVQPATLKKLRQGKLDIEDEIDLHGMTVDNARNYLRAFLGECEASGTRVIRIVHGKGYRSQGAPVIKAMVNRWLREVPMVLAFHSTIPAQGGTGAVIVLLKK
ncbi:MAG: Smr/MutS family protein, partial [Gammaproteobacteria bacterium]